jgi:hypothetical protein
VKLRIELDNGSVITGWRALPWFPLVIFWLLVAILSIPIYLLEDRHSVRWDHGIIIDRKAH